MSSDTPHPTLVKFKIKIDVARRKGNLRERSRRNQGDKKPPPLFTEENKQQSKFVK